MCNGATVRSVHRPASGGRSRRGEKNGADGARSLLVGPRRMCAGARAHRCACTPAPRRHSGMQACRLAGLKACMHMWAHTRAHALARAIGGIGPANL
eukprot:5813192-Alexandrium_andersonii.AAC.1